MFLGRMEAWKVGSNGRIINQTAEMDAAFVLGLTSAIVSACCTLSLLGRLLYKKVFSEK